MLAAHPPLGRTFRRGEPGYEPARLALSWNARLPARYPDVIVQANDVHEVVRAVRLARGEGLRLTVKSGGHSWAGNHVRDGGLVLDLARLRDFRVDKGAMRAVAGPGCGGYALAVALKEHGLFFPAGHCKGVCLGGYLLQGGFGWHSRALGLACQSVVGLDLVTAEGDLVHASETENADLYWAARGAGPGFFCVVTGFHLRLYPRPRVIGAAAQTFRMEQLDEVYRWLHAIGPSVPRSVELQALMTRAPAGGGGPGIEVVAPVFADTLREARKAVSFLTDSPLRKHSRIRTPFLPTGLRALYRGVMAHYPSEHRYAVDNMWTSASFEALLPGLREIARTLPAAPSHMLWLNWAPPRERPDMAFSMEDEVYIALYGVWKQAADDRRFADWAVSNMRAMAPLATGVQLADENLGQRPARFVKDDHLSRLDAIRATHDAAGRFQPWMGRP